MDLGLMQEDVARRVGVNKWTVLNWESGKTAPAVRFYPRIISFLGYNPLPEGETFQERLKAARQARGLSWKRLAKELGVWESTVRDWEMGIHNPTPRLRLRLHDMLDL
jgi:transcriptional regulator with XRE-family HTH domain